MAYEELLSEIGLTDSEIKVYLALLELDTSSVGPLIEKSRVPDSKIYQLLGKLIEKGLASFVIKNNVKHYQASDPTNILALLDDRSRKIDEQKQRIKTELIPAIKLKKQLKEEKQEAIVYEGIEGVKAAYQKVLDTMNKGDEYYVFLIIGEALRDPRSIRFFANYHTRRAELGIHVKFIGPEEDRIVITSDYHHKLAENRFTKEKFPVGIIIFKGYVMTLIWGKKPTAFIIKSEQNYSRYKHYFLDVWKKAKK